MQLLNKRPESLVDMKMHYCPGCSHGIIHRLVAEVMDELDIRNRTIGIAPVGCSVFADKYFNCDMIQGPHGRGPAIATGLKRTTPGAIVFSYQGDGDLASIGMAEIVHTAIRSENITVIYVNNAIYGMTGGQMAPTTLIGQKATTCPHGRDAKLTGDPIKMSEMLATIEGAKYIERTSVHTAPNVIKTKNAIKKAFENQINNGGFSMVEILSTCPTNWKLDPVKSLKYVNDNMTKVFPLGVYKDSKGGE
ncbi:MAG: 2-oxoglutarate oxidoreductase [Elusimicrobiales bacterium]|nr:2-oxoglutarate oxidoreductase [Elusimicrobiales bacterium]